MSDERAAGKSWLQIATAALDRTSSKIQAGVTLYRLNIFYVVHRVERTVANWCEIRTYS